MSATPAARPRLAVHKFASCDGCQLQLLNLEDELLPLAERVEIAHFLEASSRVLPGPWDVSLVEGSVTTPHDVERIRQIREQSAALVAIGACATAGGLQALRNQADVEEWKAHVYPEPRWLDVLATSEPLSAHVKVDYEIQGCPVNGRQVLRVLLRLLLGAAPDLPGHSVCIECKRRGATCVLVARRLPCLGPVTRAGCGALCPSLGRDCYGCFGPADDPNVDALARQLGSLGFSTADVARRLRGIYSAAPPFARAATALGRGRG